MFLNLFKRRRSPQGELTELRQRDKLRATYAKWLSPVLPVLIDIEKRIMKLQDINHETRQKILRQHDLVGLSLSDFLFFTNKLHELKIEYYFEGLDLDIFKPAVQKEQRIKSFIIYVNDTESFQQVDRILSYLLRGCYAITNDLDYEIRITTTQPELDQFDYLTLCITTLSHSDPQ